PGAFTGLEESSKVLRVADLAYFSLNVVTMVALTDVQPVSKTAQTLVVLQEFASVFYMACVIARLAAMDSPATAKPGDVDGDGPRPRQDQGPRTQNKRGGCAVQGPRIFTGPVR